VSASGASGAGWRKSRYSGANGSCVEVACRAPGLVAVRDSADPGGPRLWFTAGQWTVFAAAVKQRAAGR
jgi:hypothetical protein